MSEYGEGETSGVRQAMQDAAKTITALRASLCRCGSKHEAMPDGLRLTYKLRKHEMGTR